MKNPAEGRVTVKDNDDKYLHIVLTPTTKSWRYIRKVNGRMVFITLGKYPDMTPVQARNKSRETSAAYQRGEDPQLQKRESKKVQTWESLFQWYLTEHAKPNKRTWKADENQERLYCSGWRKRPWQAISKKYLKRWHQVLTRRSGAIAADRALALVKSVFNRAISEDVIKGDNPAVGIGLNHKTAKSYARKRFMSAVELTRLFRALDEYHDQDMADFFRLALFTGARRGNVMAMKWDHITLESLTWTIPKEELKRGQEDLQIPLSNAASAILQNRWDHRKSDTYVFPAKKKTSKTPHLTEPKKAWAAICSRAQLEDLRIHDLRRTLGSWMAMGGASLPIIGATLGHSSSRTTEIYARLGADPVRLHQGQAVAAMLQAVNGKAEEGGK